MLPAKNYRIGTARCATSAEYATTDLGWRDWHLYPPTFFDKYRYGSLAAI